MFEAGRQVVGLIDKEERSKDVMARVLLHSMGRELGALLKGKFDNVLAVSDSCGCQLCMVQAIVLEDRHRTC